MGWMGYTDLVGFDHVWWLGAPGLDCWFSGIRYLRFGLGLPLPIGSPKLPMIIGCSYEGDGGGITPFFLSKVSKGLTTLGLGGLFT